MHFISKTTSSRVTRSYLRFLRARAIPVLRSFATSALSFCFRRERAMICFSVLVVMTPPPRTSREQSSTFSQRFLGGFVLCSALLGAIRPGPDFKSADFAGENGGRYRDRTYDPTRVKGFRSVDVASEFPFCDLSSTFSQFDFAALPTGSNAARLASSLTTACSYRPAACFDFHAPVATRPEVSAPAKRRIHAP